MRISRTLSIAALLIFIVKVTIAQHSALSIQSLKRNVYALADDSMEGRNTATPGGQMAAKYISNEYKKLGLVPKGDNNSYLQNYTFFAGRNYIDKNELTINGESLTLGKDYYALNNSGNGKVSSKAIYVGHGAEVPNQTSDYLDKEKIKGKVFIIDANLPPHITQHSENYKYYDLSLVTETAINKGASAIIFYSSDTSFKITSNLKIKSKEYQIPIVFVSKREIFGEKKLIKKIELIVNLQNTHKTAQNIVGYIENKSEYTIVLGAHYDHLGLGEDGNSLYKGPPAIHNGADDNASGVATIIELAKIIKENKEEFNNYNYLFLAFSGEELGLYGSKEYVNNIVNHVDSNNIDCMINLDMVGRLGEKEKNLEVSGVGTSKSFDTIINGIKISDIRVKLSQGGIGPSDHSSFYLKNIPVLHFFTGQHEDYHKPSDDAPKINFEGMQKVGEFILQTILEIEKRGKLGFQKTKEDSTSTPRFKITLGIVPDYMFEGEGLRIDGVSEGKPAQKAGLIQGDIIIKLGDNTVNDMTGYMRALAQFQKGDETVVTIKRGIEEKKIKIVF